MMRNSLSLSVLASIMIIMLARSSSPQTSGPTCILTNPADGSTVAGKTVYVGFWSYDPNGNFNKWEFYVDGTLNQTLYYSKHMKNGACFYWNTTAFPNGSHSFTVKVYTKQGTGTAAPFTVNVLN